jgi:hypothetical protein
MASRSRMAANKTREPERSKTAERSMIAGGFAWGYVTGLGHSGELILRELCEASTNVAG